MATTPTYGGVAVFGDAVRMRYTPVPLALQVTSYFGIDGQQAISGGSRGRTFEVSGVWLADTTEEIRAIEAAFLSYADGIARPLVDTFGASWSNVIFTGEYRTGNLCFVNGGYCLPYMAIFRGLR